MAISNLINWKHRNKLLFFQKCLTSVLLFAVVKRGRRVHYGNVDV